MNVMLNVLADTIRPGMVDALTELRDGGAKWLDGEPRAKYHGVLGDIEGWSAITVS